MLYLFMGYEEPKKRGEGIKKDTNVNERMLKAFLRL